MKFNRINMAKNLWLFQGFLAFICGTYFFSLDAVEGKSQLDNHETQLQLKRFDLLQAFEDELKKYKPNAPWIIDYFMDLNLKQFGVAFKHIVKILTVPTEQWFYFSNSPKDFDFENYWRECLWQCFYYEKWMIKLSLDTDSIKYKIKAGTSLDDETLVYCDQNYSKINFLKILSTLEELNLGKNLSNRYYQFYAFYTDCLSHFFCSAVYSCYECMDDSNAYKSFLAIAKKSLNKMKQNLLVLKKSKFFYPNYKMTLDNYKKILALLEAEKIKAYLGSR